MKFSQLAVFFEKIEQTSSRLIITELLAELFKKLNPLEIEKSVYLLQGRVAPLFNKIEFGMAEKMIIKGIILALDLQKDTFLKEYKKIGDLGNTVEYFKKQQPRLESKDLEILDVYNTLYKLAVTGGEGSQEIKIKIIAFLIRQLDYLSCRYLVRIPLGVMRLGFSDMTVLDAFSWMIKGDKSLRPIIEKAYHVRPDLGFIGQTLKKDRIDRLKKIKPEIFTPILMMKAERLSSSKEIIKKIGQCIVEPKYDGFRLQVHYLKREKEVKLYSRNLEDVSFMYPDIIAGVKKEVRAQEIIFEGEAVGFDPQTGNFLPFQETVQRKRKFDIEKKAKEIPLKLFAFELLYLNGENLLDTPFLKRRRQLEQSIILSGDIFTDTLLIAPENIINDEQKLESMFDEVISKGLEGIMAKKINGIYQPGARGWNWIKFKRSYASKIVDTIDCLVMGYDLGKGKRTDFGIGVFLVGIYDEKQDQFLTVAKIGTGLTDEEWKQLKIKAQISKIKVKPANYSVNKLTECDIWILPKIVVEIKADEITRSPVHTAGFALRFPRLQRFRDDKGPNEITSLKELEKMFRVQMK